MRWSDFEDVRITSSGAWVSAERADEEILRLRKEKERLGEVVTKFQEACEAAYHLLTDVYDGLGHHKDNPVPTLLRNALKEGALFKGDQHENTGRDSEEGRGEA